MPLLGKDLKVGDIMLDHEHDMFILLKINKSGIQDLEISYYSFIHKRSGRWLTRSDSKIAIECF